MKYKAGMFEYNNEWMSDEVLDKLVGTQVTTKYADKDVILDIKKENDQVIAYFDLDVDVPPNQYYLDFSIVCGFVNETFTVESIEGIERIMIVQSHTNTSITKITRVI